MAQRIYTSYTGWRRWYNGVLFATIGTRTNAIITAFILIILVAIISSFQKIEEAPETVEMKLEKALNLANHFEQNNRKLRVELENEARIRRIANQTSTALSDQVRQQNQTLLNNEQQLAFYRQLLDERGSATDEVLVRSFDIVPDFRENSFQLLAVLNRGGTDQDLFKGKLDLALSLRRANGEEFEHQPVFEIGALNTEFRYYIEIEVGFSIPAGTEILNGQLALFNSEGELISSRLLQDQIL